MSSAGVPQSSLAWPHPSAPYVSDGALHERGSDLGSGAGADVPRRRGGAGRQRTAGRGKPKLPVQYMPTRLNAASVIWRSSRIERWLGLFIQPRTAPSTVR